LNDFIKTGYVSEVEENDTPSERKRKLKPRGPDGPDGSVTFLIGVVTRKLRK